MGLYRNRRNGGLVMIDDDKVHLFHGEYEPAEGEAPEPEEATEPGDAGSLKGKALEEALKEAGLSTEGTADEKRARLADHQAATI